MIPRLAAFDEKEQTGKRQQLDAVYLVAVDAFSRTYTIFSDRISPIFLFTPFSSLLNTMQAGTDS